MGQKVNPIGIRLGYSKKSNSFWYPDGDTFANTLKNDLEIREFILSSLPKSSSISKIFIERISQNVKISINTAKPGIVIGKKGEDIEKLRTKLSSLYNISVTINVEEIKKPDLDAI
jgi:small subunit ribosomal protein S3